MGLAAVPISPGTHRSNKFPAFGSIFASMGGAAAAAAAAAAAFFLAAFFLRLRLVSSLSEELELLELLLELLSSSSCFGGGGGGGCVLALAAGTLLTSASLLESESELLPELELDEELLELALRFGRGLAGSATFSSSDDSSELPASITRPFTANSLGPEPLESKAPGPLLCSEVVVFCLGPRPRLLWWELSEEVGVEGAPPEGCAGGGGGGGGAPLSFFFFFFSSFLSSVATSSSPAADIFCRRYPLRLSAFSRTMVLTRGSW
mmetsp:Transcript_51666/g.113278  ORF Transcript_51666/g.113278 Transcript_51666/m.113278 type:complete len:264 (-) Transcript_51666:293-1084(-)